MDFLMHSIALFHKGGPIMYVLAACSLLTAAIAAERWQYYRRLAAGSHGFTETLADLLENGRITEALALCDQHSHLLAWLTRQSLQAYTKGQPLLQAIEFAAAAAAARLRAYLHYLSAIVTLSPLLGLLGTVIGMIGSFSVLNLEAGQPAAITGGVGEALVATAAGLCVAVLAFISHTYFAHRLDAYISEMEAISAILVQNLSGKSYTGRDAHEVA